jgi:succinate dehydrogenase / fumarate reductase cytochrome b subunit
LIVLPSGLMAVAGGGRAYTPALAALSMPIFKLLTAALLIAFCYHLVAGIRHLIWDTGHYLERAQSKRSAAIVSVVSVLLMAVCLYFAFFAGAHAP